MDSEYILSFDDFQQYCEKNKQAICGVNGNCKKCTHRCLCSLLDKQRTIEAILHMNDKEPCRFPRLLSVFKKWPELLHMIPSQLYGCVIGRPKDTLGCIYDGSVILDNLDKIKDVLGILTDDESRLSLLNVLMFRLTMDRDYCLRACCYDPSYFISAYRNLTYDEVFVNCGAYRGETFEEYCKYNAPPKSAYLFEPDIRHKKAIEKVVQQYRNISNITVIHKGAYNETKNLYFCLSKTDGSHLSVTQEKGSIEVPVTSIDDAINEDISFINMDIEGSEQAALIGAKKHILSSYPKLAISLYHRISDLWEIPLLINRLYPEYTNYIIRHHRTFGFATVLYAFR